MAVQNRVFLLLLVPLCSFLGKEGGLSASGSVRVLDILERERGRGTLEERPAPHGVNHGWVLGNERRQEVGVGLLRGRLVTHLGSSLVSPLSLVGGTGVREVHTRRVLEAVQLMAHRLLLRELGSLGIRVRVTVPVLRVSIDGGRASLLPLDVLMLGSAGLVLLGKRSRVVAEVLVEHARVSHPWVGHGVGVRRERVVGEGRSSLFRSHHVVRAIHGGEVRRRREGMRRKVGHSLGHGIDTGRVLGRGILTGLHVGGLLGHVGEENSGHLLAGIRRVKNLV